jgi:hypothetical protein
MGLLKKEVKRPMQEIGKDNCVIWFSDNNELLINGDRVRDMLKTFFNKGLCPDVCISRLEALQGTFSGIGDIPMDEAVKELILANIPNLIEYFLVYIDLPESVEGLVISKIKEFKRQQGVILDKINQKRKKLL